MDSKDDHPLYAAINGKLAEIAAASPVRLPWHDAWQELAPTSTPRERLPVYRAIRDSGSLPAEAGFFLIAWIVDLVADEQAEDALGDTESRLEGIRQEYGLDDDASADENAPPEYQEAMQASHDAWDELYTATLDDLGELEMAQLYRADNDQFEREYRAGQQFFHGEDVSDNDWLDALHDAVSACVEAESLMAPLGLRYFEDDGLWEIVIYPSPVELVGGAHDGEVATPGFLVDLELLRDAFDEVRHYGWNPIGLNDPDGPYVSVEGVFQGKEVFVRLLAYAPEGEEPGIKVDATGKWRHRRE